MSDSNSSPPGTTVVPSVTQPIVNANGIVTQTWWSFFYSLYQRTGSAMQQTAGSASNAISALQSQVQSLASQITSQGQTITQLESEIGQGQEVSFFNNGTSIGQGSSINALGIASFAPGNSKGIINLEVDTTAGGPIQAQVLGASPFVFTAPSSGALSLSGGQVTQVMLTRGSQTIQLFP